MAPGARTEPLDTKPNYLKPDNKPGEMSQDIELGAPCHDCIIILQETIGSIKPPTEPVWVYVRDPLSYIPYVFCGRAR